MMQSGGIHAIEIVFLILLLFVVIFAALARKLQTPYPIVLVIAGLLLSFIPGIPKISLNPDVIFLVVLPPLLYSAAWLTSWRDFKFNLVSILLLAFGLVGFTVLGVAGTAASEPDAETTAFGDDCISRRKAVISRSVLMRSSRGWVSLLAST